MIEQLTKRPCSPGAEALLGKRFVTSDLSGSIALLDYMGTDLCIEQAARVSTDTEPGSDNRAFIRKLRDQGHKNPTEQIEAKLEWMLTMFAAEQVIRHRTSNVNKMSGRYRHFEAFCYVPKDWRPKRGCIITPAKQLEIDSKVREFNEIALGLYEWLDTEGVARELARMALPASTLTKFVWKMDLSNLFHFLDFRLPEAAQKEVRDPSHLLAGILQALAPHSFEAWIDYCFGAVTFNRMEMEMLYRCAELGRGQFAFALMGWPGVDWPSFERKLTRKFIPNFTLNPSDGLTAEQAIERLRGR